MQHIKHGKLKPGKTVIHLVSVQQEQVVPAASPLLQLVDQNQRVVRLGVEPENYVRLQLNQPVLLTPANKPVDQPVKGRIATITHQVDPVTRLLNVFVRPELNQQLLINDFVQAQIIVSSANTLLAPAVYLLFPTLVSFPGGRGSETLKPFHEHS